MNNTHQTIKDEIYSYITQLELTPQELDHIDTYVKDLLVFLEPIINTQEAVVSQQESFTQLKKMILDSMPRCPKNALAVRSHSGLQFDTKFIHQ